MSRTRRTRESGGGLFGKLFGGGGKQETRRPRRRPRVGEAGARAGTADGDGGGDGGGNDALQEARRRAQARVAAARSGPGRSARRATASTARRKASERQKTEAVAAVEPGQTVPAKKKAKVPMPTTADVFAEFEWD